MSDNKDSGEGEKISKNDEVKASDIVEDLKVGKLSLHKYVENFETESNKINLVGISDKNDSGER